MIRLLAFRQGHRGRQRGLSLIEVVIALAMIGILASIAYPSYVNVVVKNNRSVAHSSLVELAARQEAYFSQRRRFASDLTQLGYPSATIYVRNSGGLIPNDGDSAPSGAIYLLRISTANDRGYVVEAGPVNMQSQDDECGTLRLNAQGVKSASTGSSNCW